jgi:hypothetical protein
MRAGAGFFFGSAFGVKPIISANAAGASLTAKAAAAMKLLAPGSSGAAA